MNHYVYEITNIINNKKYIGKRSCECNINNDTYMGSGKYLKYSISKYGINNFVKEIIYIAQCEIEAYDWENYLITRYKLNNNPRFYNISCGGIGSGKGINHVSYGKKHTLEAKLKMSKSKLG